MATFSFNDEFVKCGIFKMANIGAVYDDSAAERVNNNSYYAPLLISEDAVPGNGYTLNDDLALQITNNISFTVDILYETGKEVEEVDGTIIYLTMSPLRVNNLYGAMGIFYFHYKGTYTSAGYVIDSAFDFTGTGGIPEYRYNVYTLVFVSHNNKIYPAAYTTDDKYLHIFEPLNGIPLYDDFIVKSGDAIENPYDPGGVSKPDGGDGVFGADEETEDIEDLLPNGSAESDSSNSGLFTRYAMTSSMLRTLGAALYTDDLLAKIGKEIMSFLYNSPAEAIISLVSYPFSISSIMGTTSSNIKFGSLEIPVTGNRLNSTFAQIDWGYVELRPFWGNFLDYAPHTKIDLYLPWCTGSVQLDPHECYPGRISVKTNIELSKGTCVHSVFGNQGVLMGTYSGVVGSQLPITALDSSGKMLSLVTAAASLGVSALAGGGAQSAEIRGANQAPPPISMAGNIAAQAAWRNEQAAIAAAPYYKIQRTARGVALASSIAAFRTPQHIVRNNSFSGNGAGLGMQFPFIIISRPEQSVPENYSKYFGYPSNIYVHSLQTVGGYTEIGSIHLDGIPCTENEREEILELLKGGVIL